MPSQIIGMLLEKTLLFLEVAGEDISRSKRRKFSFFDTVERSEFSVGEQRGGLNGRCGRGNGRRRGRVGAAEAFSSAVLRAQGILGGLSSRV